MAAPIPPSLRDRLVPPAASRSREGAAPRRRATGRVLDLAAALFGVEATALVAVRPGGLAVEAASGAVHPGEAAAAARRLFEALAEAGSPASGVVEEIVPGRGFAAAAPILSDNGRCLGAVCLLDGDRRALLTGMQRRLFAEFGHLLLASIDPAGEEGDALLQMLADAEPEAFAILDEEGRCLLRNARFAALVGGEAPGEAARAALRAARGREAGWLAGRLARDVPPVGVTRSPRPDGSWLAIEERRGPHGRSLLARVEALDAFGGEGELGLLFERCPVPMFVYDRDTAAVLAANDAALALYGWERDAFLCLGLDRIGAVDPTRRGWIHRARDGRALHLAGHAVGLAWRGRPAVLVTVTPGEEAAPADRAA